MPNVGIGRTNCSYYSTRVDLCGHQILLVGLNIDWDCLMPHCIVGSVFRIRSETCRTEAQFCQNLMKKKESLPGRPKFCQSGPRSGIYFEDCGLMWPVGIPTGFHTPTAGLCKGTVKKSMAMLVLPIISLTWVTSFNKVTSIINWLPTLSKQSRDAWKYALLSLDQNASECNYLLKTVSRLLQLDPTCYS